MFFPLIFAAAELVAEIAVPALIGGAIGGALTMGAIFIAEVTIPAIKEKMIERNCKKAIVSAIDRCNNTISLKDLEKGGTFEIKGETISDDIRQNQIITC